MAMGLRRFLGLSLEESSPDHSTLTNTRQRLPAKVFEEVFQFVLAIADLKGLLAGKPWVWTARPWRPTRR
jgi:transposase